MQRINKITIKTQYIPNTKSKITNHPDNNIQKLQIKTGSQRGTYFSSKWIFQKITKISKQNVLPQQTTI